MDARWTFYGRQEELGALLERMRAGRWFFGAIRGRRRIGKTALIQQALDTLKADGPDGRRALLVQLPDSSPADVAAVFRGAARETGLDAAGFAPNHGTYARTIAGRYPRIGADVRHWFSANVNALETDCYERDLTGAVAVLLLDRFRAKPALWRDCAHLNRWNPADDPTFAHYLASWTAHLRAHGVEPRAPAVIGAALGVDPGRVPTRPGPRER